MIPRCLLVLLLCCSAAGLAPAATVRHYEAELEPDLEARTLQGRVRLVVVDAGELELDVGELQIDAVEQGGQPLAFERSGPRLKLAAPAPAAPAASAASAVPPPVAAPAERTVDIRYHGAPVQGLRFLSPQQQVYTAFATGQWLPSVAAPGARATLLLRLALPSALKVVASGELQSSETRADGKTVSTWWLGAPTPSYLFGFAAGLFNEVVDNSARPTLRYLAPPHFSAAQLRQVFRETRHMIAFYERRSGIQYPGSSYTQVMVDEAAGQEAAGFAVLGQAYGQRVLTDEKNVWLGVHELAHQWWGNAVTNRAWTEFWLNEGVATFMTAAWFEDRFGRGAYLEHIDAARAKWEKLRDAGGDQPLVFLDWSKPSAADRSLVYDKGSYAMHRLREVMGDEPFWRGLGAYTRGFWGRSVSSRDFQQAMQAATEVDLSPFFDTWVYRSKR